MKKIISIIAVLLIVAVFASGCGSDKGTTANNQRPNETVASEMPTVEPKPIETVGSDEKTSDAGSAPVAGPTIDIREYLDGNVFDAEQCARDLGYFVPSDFEQYVSAYYYFGDSVDMNNIKTVEDVRSFTNDPKNFHAYTVTLFGNGLYLVDDTENTIGVYYLYNGGEKVLVADIHLSGTGTISVKDNEEFYLTEQEIVTYVAVLERVKTMNDKPVDDLSLGITWRK